MVVVELYYSDSCPACVSFRPQWSILRRSLNTLNIASYEYEAGRDRRDIEKNNIQRVPTVLVKKGGKGYVCNYTTASEILNFIKLVKDGKVK